MTMIAGIKVERVHDFCVRIPPFGGMRVPGYIYADARRLDSVAEDQSLQQVVNVAHLPGIVRGSYAMPDIHWGYGFPIGGVAAFDAETGVISPGGVGYDINCGVRLLRSALTVSEVRPKLEELITRLYRDVPTGVGVGGPLKLNVADEKRLLVQGARWAVEHGYGVPEDIDHTEELGGIAGADADAVSQRALTRGRDQAGTVGSGNHFVEVEYVEEIYDEGVARAFGLFPGQVTVSIHCGSRGLGYQICDDYLVVMNKAVEKYHMTLPDRQLACAPFRSPEGQTYFAAMKAAANFAYANRQVISHWVRGTFEYTFKMGPRDLAMDLVYDVAHNIAKVETHRINGETKDLVVHRKGATRAFPAGLPEVPPAYRDVGQPVLIPGDMGRCSYVLVGTPEAMAETFGTTCHGAGRVLSRTAARRMGKGRSITKELEAQGIIVRCGSRASLAEEASFAYKDVTDVVNVVQGAGISNKVAKLHPIGVIKG